MLNSLESRTINLIPSAVSGRSRPRARHETNTPVTSVTVNGTSLTHSYSPSLEGFTVSSPRSHSPRPALSTDEESLFLRQGDYWIVRYQGHVAFLKATRGLYCLSFLLRHPGREFHVSELVGKVTERPLALPRGCGHAAGACQGGRLSDAGPILDARAKAEYKRRLDELRKDLEEAERFNDLYRTERVHNEINAIAAQLASAVGLGGRDRRTGLEAERARCAVTKRIKDTIYKLGEGIPSLRRYLAAQIRTGYFCVYNPNPECPVVWKF